MTENNCYRDALAAYLSGLTTKKNDKEIWWKRESLDFFEGIVDYDDITVEPIDDIRYIIRTYYKDGTLESLEEYNNRIIKTFVWYSNGQLWY